jgi:hypothetical protein
MYRHDCIVPFKWILSFRPLLIVSTMALGNQSVWETIAVNRTPQDAIPDTIRSPICYPSYLPHCNYKCPSPDHPPKQTRGRR